jgi:hypothetical protein
MGFRLEVKWLLEMQLPERPQAQEQQQQQARKLAQGYREMAKRLQVEEVTMVTMMLRYHLQRKLQGPWEQPLMGLGQMVQPEQILMEHWAQQQRHQCQCILIPGMFVLEGLHYRSFHWDW